MRRELGRFLSAFDDPTPTLEALRRAIPPVDGVVTGTLPFLLRPEEIRRSPLMTARCWCWVRPPLLWRASCPSRCVSA